MATKPIPQEHLPQVFKRYIGGESMESIAAWLNEIRRTP